MHSHLPVVVFVLLCLINLYRSQNIHWDYSAIGPDVWKDLFPKCAGSSQSPININTACTAYKSFDPFNLSSAYDLTQQFTLTNNGHTISGTQTNKTTFPLQLSGGGLNGIFEFQNFHLHWGENYNSGSEHQVNDVKYAGEIHFVHKNPITSELAVLGMFMKSSKPANTSDGSSGHRRRRRRKSDMPDTQNTTRTEWARYFTKASQINDTNNTDVISLKLTTLMSTHLYEFWRYSGSLTIPTCDEGVIWTVFKTPIDFTDAEIASFRRNISAKDFRDPQPLNNRVVYRSFVNNTASTESDLICCTEGNLSGSLRTKRNSDSLANRQLSSYFVLLLSFLFLIF